MVNPLVKLHLYNFNTSLDLISFETFLPLSGEVSLFDEEHAHCRNRLEKSIWSTAAGKRAALFRLYPLSIHRR